MGNGLDCCVRRPKEDASDNAADYIDNNCIQFGLAPYGPHGPAHEGHYPDACAQAAGIFTPDAPDSVRKIDDMGTTEPQDQQVEMDTPRFFPMDMYPPTSTIPCSSKAAASGKEPNISEEPPVVAAEGSSEELDQMPSFTTSRPPKVQYHSMTQWLNAPEADEDNPYQNEQSGKQPPTHSLTNWYTGSYTPDFSQEQRGPAEKGEAGREAATGATLFYNMSFDRSVQGEDPTERPVLGTFGSFQMSQPVHAFPPTRGTASNVPQDDQ